MFRGFAAILMVLNHAGNAWLSRADAASGLDGAIVLLGSAAPALFFCATGIGMGLSRRPSPDWRGLARKIVLLVIADLFLGWSVQRWFGVDFFAFCAVSMLAVALVTASRRPVACAVAAIIVTLALRYAMVGHMQPWAQEYPAVAFVSGIDGVTDVSYPISPWIVFPLGGFILGRLCIRANEAARISAAGNAVLAALGGVAALASYLLVERGGVLHRWGSVSIAYFFCAVAIVVFAWLLAGMLGAFLPAPAAALLETRGPTSFIVVPVHYVLIGLAVELLWPPYPAQAWLLAALVACVVAIGLAKWIAICLRRLVELASVQRWLSPAIAALAALAMCALVWGKPLGCLLIASAGEILVAAMLSSPARFDTRASTARAI